MAAKPGNMPAPLPEPPPVPVSGISPARRAIAPQLTEEPKGVNPARELAQRQKDAMARFEGDKLKANDAEAGEDAATPPKAPAATATPVPKPKADPGVPSDGKAPAASVGDGKSEAGKAAAKADESSSATSEDAPHRYELKSLKKWAEAHPDEAAEIGVKLFRLPADTTQEWIRIKNRERKARENIRGENETGLAAIKAEREAMEAAAAAMDGAAGKLAPIADLWEAVAEKVAADPQNPQIDFEAADAAFMENAKIPIDDYMRLRARRSIGSGTDAVKLRVENAKLKRALEGKASDQVKTTPAESPTPAKVEAGTADSAGKGKSKQAKDWSGELPAKHKLRQFENWNELLDGEMRRYFDADTKDYDADPEEIANKILKREVERMMEDSPDAGDDLPPKPKPTANGAARSNGHAKPKPKDGIPDAAELTPRARKAKDPDDDQEDDKDHPVIKDLNRRQAWALQRHELRRQGKLE